MKNNEIQLDSIAGRLAKPGWLFKLINFVANGPLEIDNNTNTCLINVILILCYSFSLNI